MKENIINEEKLKNAQTKLYSLYQELDKDYKRLSGMRLVGGDEWEDEKFKIYTHITDCERNIEETKKDINIAKENNNINKDFIKNFEYSYKNDEEIAKVRIQRIKEQIIHLNTINNIFSKKEPVVEKEKKKNNEIWEAQMALDLMNEQLENMKKIEKMQSDYLDYIEQNVENVDEKKIDNKKDIKEIEKVFPNKKQVNKKKKCIIF